MKAFTSWARTKFGMAVITMLGALLIWVVTKGEVNLIDDAAENVAESMDETPVETGPGGELAEGTGEGSGGAP